MDVYVEHKVRVELKMETEEFRTLWCMVDETLRLRINPAPAEEAMHSKLTSVISQLPGV